MSFGYILNTVAADVGIDLTNANERALLVSKANQAAREVYRSRDLPVALKEVFVRSTPNKEIALPPFIGELRAIRSGCADEHYCTPKWNLHSQYPRYTKVPWEDLWHNWRDKGRTPIAIEWLNTAPGNIIYPAADAELTITIVGETSNSNRAVDNIVVSGTEVAWTKTFLNITRIAKNKVTDYNVILEDADGNECAIIYADQLEASYKIVDVSMYPTWDCCTCDDGTSIMEVLYKPILNLMSADTDTFPVDGFDDVIIVKTKQLIAEQEQGQEERAILMDGKAARMIKEISADKTGHLKKRISYGPNPYYDMFSHDDWNYPC
jgi:hypothetical protein